VPEPSTIALLTIGLGIPLIGYAGMGLEYRRKRSALSRREPS
jgi:hypothetical protein